MFLVISSVSIDKLTASVYRYERVNALIVKERLAI